MGSFLAILKNTLQETIRQPIYALVLTIGCLLTAFSPATVAHIYTFGAGSSLEQPAIRMVADFGLSTILLMGLLLAALCASSVVNDEMENGTALTVLTKNISRWAFVCGKFCGVGSAVFLGVIAAVAVLMLTQRVGASISVSDSFDYVAMALEILALLVALTYATLRNYFRGRSWLGSYSLTLIIGLVLVFAFYALFDKEYNFILFSHPVVEGEMAHAPAPTYDWQVFMAGILIAEAVLILTSVSVAASTRLNTAGTFAVTAIVAVMGLTCGSFCDWTTSPILEGGVDEILQRAPFHLWQAVFPNLDKFWMSEALVREKPIPFSYVTQMTSYTIIYILSMLFIAAFLFDKREAE